MNTSDSRQSPVVGIDVVRAERLARLLAHGRRHRIANPTEEKLAGDIAIAFALKEAATKALGQLDLVRNLWDAMARIQIVGPETLLFDNGLRLKARTFRDQEVVVAAVFHGGGILHLLVEPSAQPEEWASLPEHVQRLVVHRRDRIQAGAARHKADELVRAAGFSLVLEEGGRAGHRVPLRVEGKEKEGRSPPSLSWAHDGPWVAVALLEADATAHGKSPVKKGQLMGEKAAPLFAPHTHDKGLI
jgi:phosphopantetheinyl transferase (holo-ACP synthase)